MDEEVTSSVASYPPAKMVRDMYTLATISAKAERIRTRAWTRFKSGN